MNMGCTAKKYPKRLKGNHMPTGSLFIVMKSLREGWELQEFLQQECSLHGNVRLPQPITIDWSHSQMAIFNRYCEGSIPSKFSVWPIEGMPTEAAMQQPMHLAQPMPPGPEYHNQGGYCQWHATDGEQPDDSL